MTTDELKKQLSEIPAEELILKVKSEVSRICKSETGAFKMSVPVNVYDTDMMLIELINRYEKIYKTLYK